MNHAATGNKLQTQMKPSPLPSTARTNFTSGNYRPFTKIAGLDNGQHHLVKDDSSHKNQETTVYPTSVMKDWMH